MFRSCRGCQDGWREGKSVQEADLLDWDLSGCLTGCKPLCLSRAVHVQAVAETMMARDGKSPQLRLLVPTPLCGSIIGKGGATIPQLCRGLPGSHHCLSTGTRSSPATSISLESQHTVRSVLVPSLIACSDSPTDGRILVQWHKQRLWVVQEQQPLGLPDRVVKITGDARSAATGGGAPADEARGEPQLHPIHHLQMCPMVLHSHRYDPTPLLILVA